MSLLQTRALSSAAALPGRYGRLGDSDHETFLSDDGGLAARWARLGPKSRSYALVGAVGVLLAGLGALGGSLLKRSSASGGGGDDGCNYAGYRLQAVAVPSAYAIGWTPSFAEPFTFMGSVDIDLSMLVDGQRCLQLHADGLTVLAASASIGAGAAAPASVLRYDTANQRVVLALPEVPDAGAFMRLSLNYTGNLGNDMTGLYRSSYKNDAGKTINIVSTQFEATAARRAFIGFDEPASKANFSVTVNNVPAGYTAISNMPVAGIVQQPGGVTGVSFMPSPRMSTYLVALVVAPLVGVTQQTSSTPPVNVTVWAVDRANNTLRLPFALNVAVDVLPYYTSLFDLAYPLPKLDLVAVPDFAAGAMVSGARRGQACIVRAGGVVLRQARVAANKIARRDHVHSHA